MKKPSAFNPLDKKNLGESVAEALLKSAPKPLANLQPFKGAGVYAIYCSGGFKAYKPVFCKSPPAAEDAPIYVGKAVPPGARKGQFGVDSKPGSDLFNRLKQHAASIEQVSNLEVSKFYCRLLLVDDIWIPLGESLLIAKFSPVWNLMVDGFGIHDPGKGRYNQKRSRWDVLHPGRPWAEKCADRRETAGEITREVSNFLNSALGA